MGQPGLTHGRMIGGDTILMRKADLIKNHNEFEDDLHWYIDFVDRMLVAQRVV